MCLMDALGYGGYRETAKQLPSFRGDGRGVEEFETHDHESQIKTI